MRNDPRELLAVGISVGIGGRASFGDRMEVLLKRGREFSPRVSPLRLTTSAVTLLMSLIAGSQAPGWIAFAQGRASFETASVTPFVGSTRIPATLQDLPDGKLVVTGYPLQNLIAEAWGIPEERIEGRRDWMNSARFSITAQATGSPDKGETRRMLKTLLEDKFKVKVHTETRELPVFIMTVAKDGLKLNPASGSKGPAGIICMEKCRLGRLRGRLVRGGRWSFLHDAFYRDRRGGNHGAIRCQKLGMAQQ